MAEKAQEDSKIRSLLFDHWLAAAECWSKSQLLITLKSKQKNSKCGLRRWFTKQEMVQKWGAEVAQAMVDAKESDEERRKREVREHPDCPVREACCLHVP